jgi:hypothetical protein
MLINQKEVNMLYDEYVQSNDYICHHGVKGQRWGIRRYQNPDGSLTPAGRKHYHYSDKEQKKIADDLTRRRKNMIYGYGNGINEKHFKKIDPNKINDAVEKYNKSAKIDRDNWKKIENSIKDRYDKHPELIDKDLDMLDAWDPNRDKASLKSKIDTVIDIIYESGNPGKDLSSIGLGKLKIDEGGRNKELLNAYDAFDSSVSDIANDLVGRYGDTTLSSTYMNYTLRHEAEQYVRTYIESLSRQNR